MRRSYCPRGVKSAAPYETNYVIMIPLRSLSQTVLPIMGRHPEAAS